MTPLKVGSLCTGYGSMPIVARAVFDAELAWWSDVDSGPIRVMEHHYPGVPNIGDLTTADWSALPGIQILTAGYPCQPFSNAGSRLGINDPRHLWPHIAQAVSVLRPEVVLLENVAAHLRRGFDIVLSDLAALGYDAAWTVVRASDAGAPHRRDRLFILAANTDGCVLWKQPWRGGRESRQDPAVPGEPDQDFDWQQFEPAIRRWERVLGRPAPEPSTRGPRGGIKVSPRFGEWLMGLPDGHVSSVRGLSISEQLKLIGNGAVVQQVEYAVRSLLAEFDQMRWSH